MKVKDFANIPTPAPTPSGTARLCMRAVLSGIERGKRLSAQTLDSDLLRACGRFGRNGIEFYQKVKSEPLFKAARWLCL